MKHYRTYTQIADDVNDALKRRKLTLRECVSLYNQAYEKDISAGKKTPLNKDFIQRLRSGKCKVVSLRVLQLCSFLDIDPYERVLSGAVTRELEYLENLIQQKPELEKHLVSLVRGLGELAKSSI